MKKLFCPFGTAFLNIRTQCQITQWQVACSTGYHVTNLSKIEKGLYQPGIGLAMRLVMALDVPVGDLFQTVWEAFAVTVSDELRQSKTSIPLHATPFSVEGIRCPFGPLLLQARLQSGVPQRQIALLTGYNLRNIGNVEKGQQEPGVMTALMMVVAAQTDVRSFFNALQSVMLPQEDAE